MLTIRQARHHEHCDLETQHRPHSPTDLPVHARKVISYRKRQHQREPRSHSREEGPLRSAVVVYPREESDLKYPAQNTGDGEDCADAGGGEA